MIQLAKRKVLPHRFMKLQDSMPICVSCKFGQAHKCPWRTSGKRRNPIHSKEHDQPGDCMSTDQMVSAQPGLVPHMTEFLTTECIWGITLFVDHTSDWTYSHLMQSLDISETLLAKQAFEMITACAGHLVRQYHADNGRYAECRQLVPCINKCKLSINYLLWSWCPSSKWYYGATYSNCNQDSMNTFVTCSVALARVC